MMAVTYSFMIPGSSRRSARPSPTPQIYPFPYPVFDRIARFGRSGLRAAVLIKGNIAPCLTGSSCPPLSPDLIMPQQAQRCLPQEIISDSPELFRGARPNIINLSRSYSYQSRGYYASLLAAARGQRVIPSVETIIDLSARKLYENAIPELEDSLNKSLRPDPGEPDRHGCGCFSGPATDARLERFRPFAVRLVPGTGS
jgi:hypothetical protein